MSKRRPVCETGTTMNSGLPVLVFKKPSDSHELWIFAREQHDFLAKKSPNFEDLLSRPKWSYAHWQFGPGFESCSKFLITVRLQTLTQILTKTVMNISLREYFFISPRWLYSPNKSLLVVVLKLFRIQVFLCFKIFFLIFLDFLFLIAILTRVRTESGRDVGASHNLLSRRFWQRSLRRMPFFLAAGAE